MPLIRSDFEASETFQGQFSETFLRLCSFRVCVDFGQPRKFPSLVNSFWFWTSLLRPKAKSLPRRQQHERRKGKGGEPGIGAAKDAVGEILLRLLRQAVPGHPRRPEAPPAGRPAPARPRPLVRYRPPPRSARRRFLPPPAGRHPRQGRLPPLCPHGDLQVWGFM